MAKRVPVQDIRVLRDGKIISAPIGKVFDFTEQEIKDVEAVNPDAFRMPVNEDLGDEAPKSGKGKGKGPVIKQESEAAKADEGSAEL